MQFQFGFNWTPPAFMTQSAANYPTLLLNGNPTPATYGGSGAFTVPFTTPINVGPPPASATLFVTPPDTTRARS